MRVVALVEYEVLGDDEYAYIERVEDEYGGLAEVWRLHFIRSLLARGILIKSIKEIEVRYEK